MFHFWCWVFEEPQRTQSLAESFSRSYHLGLRGLAKRTILMLHLSHYSSGQEDQEEEFYGALAKAKKMEIANFSRTTLVGTELRQPSKGFVFDTFDLQRLLQLAEFVFFFFFFQRKNAYIRGSVCLLQ